MTAYCETKEWKKAAEPSCLWVCFKGCLRAKECLCVCIYAVYSCMLRRSMPIRKQKNERTWVCVCEVNSEHEVSLQSLNQVNDSHMIKRVCKQVAEHTNHEADSLFKTFTKNSQLMIKDWIIVWWTDLVPVKKNGCETSSLYPPNHPIHQQAEKL